MIVITIIKNKKNNKNKTNKTKTIGTRRHNNNIVEIKRTAIIQQFVKKSFFLFLIYISKHTVHQPITVPFSGYEYSQQIYTIIYINEHPGYLGYLRAAVHIGFTSICKNVQSFCMIRWMDRYHTITTTATAT